VTRAILIVEDADTCQATLEIALSAIAGVTIRTASSAEEALEFLSNHAAVAIVTDLHLPGLSGFDLIERIRSNQRHPRPVIMVISGDSDPAAPHRARSLGADLFFAKPYSPAEVRRALESLIHAA
jgi:CheY-like chemotaxis protein